MVNVQPGAAANHGGTASASASTRRCRDRLGGQFRRARRDAEGRGRDLRNRAYGLVHDARGGVDGAGEEPMAEEREIDVVVQAYHHS